MKTVILTGYAGFIGSQLLRDLLDKGYFVIGVDNMSEGSDKENFTEFISNPNFIPMISDISNPQLKSSIMSLLISQLEITTVDYVINNAADSHVDRSWDQVYKFIDSNIKGAINMAEIALQFKASKFVQVSTDEVFGSSPQPYVEDTLFNPENIYSTSKAAAEMFLRNYEKAYKLPLVITNGANTYGPRQGDEKLIPKTIKNILEGKKMTLYKTRAQRMWQHVKDHSQGIIKAMENGVPGEKYCLAPELDQELYTDSLVALICKTMGVDFDNVVDIVEDRLNYDLRYLMDNSKAKKDIHFKPCHNILDELPGVIDWYKSKYKK